MKFFCELPTEIQEQAKKELSIIADRLGIEFPYDGMNKAEYLDSLMNEKIVDLIGTEYAWDSNGEPFNIFLEFDKYYKYVRG